MRLVIWTLLLAAIAVVAAGTLGANDGIVSIYFRQWVVDLSLNLFLIAVVAATFAAYTVVRGIDSLIGLPRRARQWRITRRDRTAQAALREALALLLAGRYSRAHRQAQRAVEIQALTPEIEPDAEFTALGQLLSAASLHRLQDRTRRDEHLAQALVHAQRGRGVKPSEEAARLLSAEWALDDHDAERALQELSALPAGVGRRTAALRLKLQAARLSNHPLEALRTARLLAKHQGLSSAAAEGLVRTLAISTLQSARDADQLRRQWLALDAGDRRDPYVAAAAAQRITELGFPEDARAWLRPLWDRLSGLTADERAVIARALAEAMSGLDAEWLARLEASMQAWPREPMFTYAAGCALAERQLWGKARRLLENAAQNTALPAECRRVAWIVLARLAEQEQREEEAAQCWRQAALSAVGLQ